MMTTTSSKRLHVSLTELGWVFYHYAQRRGFPLADSGDANSSKILLKGMPNYNRPGITAVEPQQEANYLIDAAPLSGAKVIF